MKKILALATFAALCAAQPALAEKTGFYVGADIGTISADIDKGALDSVVYDVLASEGLYLDGSSDVDDSDTTYGLTFGYKFMPYLAVEGQYLDLGEAEYTVSGDIYDEFDKFLGTADVSTSINSSASRSPCSASCDPGGLGSLCAPRHVFRRHRSRIQCCG